MTLSSNDPARKLSHEIARELHRCDGNDAVGHSWACDQATKIARKHLNTADRFAADVVPMK